MEMEAFCGLCVTEMHIILTIQFRKQEKWESIRRQNDSAKRILVSRFRIPASACVCPLDPTQCHNCLNLGFGPSYR